MNLTGNLISILKLNTDCLIQGIGNPIRQDDALGYLFIEGLNKENIQADAEWVYQLQIENAEQWSKYKQVIVVDAHIDQIEPVKFTQLKLEEINIQDFRQLSSHALSAEVVMHLCHEHFAKTPEVYLLTLKGEQFGIGEEISITAASALKTALNMTHELTQSNTVSI